MPESPLAALLYRHEKTIYPHITVGAPREHMPNTLMLGKFVQDLAAQESVEDFFDRMNGVMDVFAKRDSCDYVELGLVKTE